MDKSLRDELLEKHEDYMANIKDWTFYGASYDGGKKFIDMVIKQHTRESSENFNKRKEDAVYINFPREIIDIFSFYLNEKPVLRELGSLDKNKLWSMFKDDCDMEGTDFNVFMNKIEVLASIYGSVGVLVDKPVGDGKSIYSRQDEISNGIYPYCSIYSRPNIFDWEYRRNKETGRMDLIYLKLMEDDGTITRWYRDKRESWAFPVDDQGRELDPVLVDVWENWLGEIPFAIVENLKHASKKYIGISDIVEISRLAASIMRNFSHGEEVIEWAAFPMFLEPYEPDDSDMPGAGGEQTEVGVTAVKQFDPENPQAKPEWLKSEVMEPMTALIQWIDKKIDLIFQMAHLSGVHAVEKSKEARSAVALRMEFNQLWSVLSNKADNMNEAELKIIYYWMMWQKEKDLYENVKVYRSKDFSVDDLSQSIFNIKESMKLVVSKLYNTLGQKKIVKMVLPDTPPNEVETIFNEIDANSEHIEVKQDLGMKDSRQAGLGKPEIDVPEEPPDISKEIKNE